MNAIDLAKFILAKKGPMTHLKLQKLLYYAEAWHLSILGGSIVDDDFEAWMHGPVCVNVWHHFKDEKDPLHNNLEIDPGECDAVIAKTEVLLDPSQKELLGDVLAEYGDKSAYHLECLTHAERPWIEARQGVPPDKASNHTISKTSMKEFYSQLLYGESPQAQTA
jgi:uncharacterized phage-associated protein